MNKRNTVQSVFRFNGWQMRKRPAGFAISAQDSIIAFGGKTAG